MISLLLCAVALAPQNVPSQAEPAVRPVAEVPGFALRDGDRVLFYGDSITEANGYCAHVETFVLTRFPTKRIAFSNAGWGGDSVAGGRGGTAQERFERDVKPFRPTVATLMLGMNDGGVAPFDEAGLVRFQTGYRQLVDWFQAALPDAARLTLIKSSPYDDVTRAPLFEGGYNAVLLRYAGVPTQLGLNRRLTVVDFNQPLVNLLTAAKGRDPELAAQILPDRVHPSAGAHIAMAAELLKAWGAPNVVTSVALDAPGAKATLSNGTSIADLRSAPGVLEWTQTDRALPWPFRSTQRVTRLVLESTRAPHDLNVQRLQIDGLEAGTYRLTIDGERVGDFTSGALAAGLNLAEWDTPMVRQAQEVHALTLQRFAVRQARWRTVEVPFQREPTAASREAMDALDRLEGDVVERQRAAAQPRPRAYRLERLNPASGK